MPIIGRNPPTTPLAQVDAYIAAANPAGAAPRQASDELPPHY